MTAGGSFDFEGRAVPVRPGDTVASALIRAGLRAGRDTRSGDPRDMFCGIGICHDCLVRVDGRAAQRACMTAAAGVNLVLRHRDGAAAPLGPLAPPAGETPETVVADIAIAGGGPAGIAAALGAAGAGLSVLLIDERARPGGQYLKPAPAMPDAQARAGERLRARLQAAPVKQMAGATIWRAERVTGGFVLGLIRDGRALEVTARALILAPGAIERPALVPGWTLPGVMTVGGAQGLLRGQGVVPGRRIVIACHGPLGLQLGAELVRAGTPPILIAERARPSRALEAIALAALADPGRVAAGIGYRTRLWRAGVPVLEGWEVTACHGSDRLEGISLAPVTGGTPRRIAADTLCMNEGFNPESALARALGLAERFDPGTGHLIPLRRPDGTTAIPDLWLVGDGAGLSGAQAALAEGALAGRAAAARLTGRDPARDTRAKRSLARARRFQSALWQAYTAPPRGPAADETILCRCEGISFGAARAAIAAGAGEPKALKQRTRIGMGRCQGRYCAGPAARLTGSALGFAPQIPLRPVPAQALARRRPEWGGHARAEHPVARPADRPAPALPARADLVVIGAGVMGVAAAWEAARAGAQVLVLDRGPVNGEASGGNAGSLHLQLLSFDFGAKAGAREQALLDTLPLQRDAIALWMAIERELSADFEIALTGGLMLATTAAERATLAAKVAAERRIGIDVSLIGAEEIRAIAPAVAPDLTAAAWCPGEGKINPLIATHAIADAARTAGARFAEGVRVTGLTTDRAGFRVATDAGSVGAGRLILAAGGWTGRLAGMLGAPLPVHAAPLQMVVTETAPPLAPCLLAHAGLHLTLKQAAAGNLIIGGAWPGAARPDNGRAQVLPDSLAGNLWTARTVLPAIAGLQVIRSWAAMNVDIDGAPVIGPLPGLPTCVVVAGANGYTLGPLLGRAAARAVLSGRADPALARFAPDRLTAAIAH